ncbi:YcnI family protein [Aquincola sp. S2]|uniref:YcnI family protein n=1 Tax=Pseudaquabacterium terrae TaxID=2732868 RepID=A0ABX2EG82_9BURK|nr:YcnI family protein [Aquabacterium terrae]NRF67612.1 YcnI family protein [Aquabacterium terrae]
MKKTLSLAAALLAGAAHAHVVLDQPQAAAGSAYKAALRVGHGCDGTPTHTLRVRLPAGLRGTKPMPKPGWTITLRREPLPQPYESHGRRISDEVAEISWRATSREAWLDDAHVDEFVLRTTLPTAPGALAFKVLQLCERGEHEWTAPLQVQPAPAPAAHHH